MALASRWLRRDCKTGSIINGNGERLTEAREPGWMSSSIAEHRALSDPGTAGHAPNGAPGVRLQDTIRSTRTTFHMHSQWAGSHTHRHRPPALYYVLLVLPGCYRRSIVRTWNLEGDSAVRNPIMAASDAGFGGLPIALQSQCRSCSIAQVGQLGGSEVRLAVVRKGGGRQLEPLNPPFPSGRFPLKERPGVFRLGLRVCGCPFYPFPPS